MKRLLSIAILSLVVAGASAQYVKNNYEYLKTDRLGTQILDMAYVSEQIDTTQAFGPVDFAAVFVNVQSKDSASILIKYQLSSDGVTWGALTTLDSLSTAAGDFKSVNLTASLLGAYRARLIFTIQDYRLGTSTATYTAGLTSKKY
jgi:hypothetical protein